MKTHWFVVVCAVIGGGAVAGALISSYSLPLVPYTDVLVATTSPTTAVSGASILFVGDIMLDRNVAVHARAVGNDALFAGVKNLFAGHDALIGNLEGTITTHSSVAQQDHTILRFTFDPHYAQILAELGFSAVSLANNHALDFGEFGYEDTLHYLDTVQVGAFGSPFNDSHLALQLMVKDKKVCMVGYHSLFNPDYSAVVQKIKSIRPGCDKVLVMTHWGVEYQHEPIAQQKEAAHAFIDAGADVVIGGHPHVVEPLEVYQGRAIFYSLGNFLFDQRFSPQVQRGLAVEVVFEDKKTRFTLTPVNTYEEASVATGGIREAVLTDVITNPDLSADIQTSILQTGSFELSNQTQISPVQVI